jgi:hypothetical protein
MTSLEYIENEMLMLMIPFSIGVTPLIWLEFFENNFLSDS